MPLPFLPPLDTAMKQISRQLLLLLAVLVSGTSPALGQGSVSGRVLTANTQTPLAGVRVLVAGTTQGAVTGTDGRYTVAAPANATLIFTLVGYTEQRVARDGRAVVDVALQPSAVDVEGLVVVGYTTQAKRTITGAVAAVQVEQLQERKVATVEDALKGRMPGVNIQTSGEPGQAAQIVIRGQNFLQANSPLYVVDGLYLRQNPNLNPNDVESIQVLKDASAASQYGAQAANGVVIITTKRGRAGDNNRIRVSSFYGIQELPKPVEMMSSREWAEVTVMAYQNAQAQNANAPTVPQGALDILSGRNTFDTDWQKEIMQRGAIQDHTLSMSGGSEAASYFLSGGYTQQEGTVITTDFERFTFRANSELRRGRLTIGENVALARSSRTAMDISGDGLSPLVEAVRMVPAIPVREEATGLWGRGSTAIPTFASNPVGLLQLRDDERQTNQAIGTLYAQLGLLESLNYRLNLGFSYNDQTSRNFNRVGVLRQNNPLDPASLDINDDLDTSLLVENLLTLNRMFGNHNVNAVLGATAQRTQRDNLFARRRSFADENLQQINAGVADLNNGGFRTESVLHSYLGRVSYALAERYLAEASFRRDGSSRFGPGNRWGNFYAGSLGWVISEEEFFQSIPLLGGMDFLKLRASYGTLGSQDFDDYQYSGLVAANRNYMFGNAALVTGGIPITLANPNIKWQENTQQNYGVDLNLFDNAVTVTADYYVSRSDDLLVQAPLPPSLGSAGSPFVNAGAVQNKGFEFGLTHQFARGDFELGTNLNLQTIENEVLTLGNGAQPLFSGTSSVSRTAVGLPMGHFWVYDMDGIFQSREEVVAHRVQPTAQPGDVRYTDRNGDGILNDNDRYYAGDPFPDLEGGFFLDGAFRSLDFNLGFRGSYGAEVFNQMRFWAERMDDNNNFPADLEPWTPENRSNTTPRALFTGLAASNARSNTDRWIEDGSYLKLQNVQVGLRLPDTMFRRFGVETDQARIYANLQNIHTWTKYRGWDPEFVGSGASNFTLARGVDSGRIYPNPRTITVGIDLGL